jgi:hypothetical protein
VPLLVAAAVILVGVGYAIAGHAAGLLWGLGVALFIMAPDIMNRTIDKPFTHRQPHQTPAPPWYYLCFIVGAAAVAGAFPFFWYENPQVSKCRSRGCVGDFGSRPLQGDTRAVSALALLSTVGAVGCVWLLWWWVRDIKAARRHSRLPQSTYGQWRQPRSQQ